MGSSAMAEGAQRRRIGTWLGSILLIVGFLGHFFAARAIGGTYLAYRDHMAGFFGLTILSGAVVAAIGWKFWKGRTDITWLIIGVIQAAIGVLIYINRFAVHG